MIRRAGHLIIFFLLLNLINAFRPFNGGQASFSASNSFNRFRQGSFGSNNFDDNMAEKIRQKKPEFDRIWLETGVVPEFLSRVPDEPLFMMVGNKKIHPNSNLETSELEQKLKFYWNADPNALYMLVMEDPIEDRPFKFEHYLVANIPGNNVEAGEVIYDKLPNFTFDTKEDENGEEVLDTVKRKRKASLVLIYKQKGRVTFDKKSIGCTPNVLSRVSDTVAIQKQFDLEGPVAGTFFNDRYEPGWSEYWLCYIASCTEGALVPVEIPGVNDNVKPDASTCSKPFQYKNRWWHKRYLHFNK